MNKEQVDTLIYEKQMTDEEKQDHSCKDSKAFDDSRKTRVLRIYPEIKPRGIDRVTRT